MKRILWLFAKAIKEWQHKKDHYILEKFPGIEMDELEADTLVFNSITGRFFDIRIKESVNNCFSISK